MTEHVTGLTRLVNHYLGQFALALLSRLHITPENPDTPIPEHVVMGVVVLILATLLALLLRSRLSVDKPGAMQQVAEILLTNPLGFGIKDLLEENVHHGALKLIPFVGSISVFVLLSNLLGVIPVFAAPTADKSVPLACAILTFLYFNWQGVRHHAVGHFGFSCRTRQHLGAHSFLDGPSLGEHCCERSAVYDFPRLIFDGYHRGLVQIGGLRRCYRCVAGHHSHRLYRPAYLRGHHSGLHFHGSALGLPGHGHGRRALVRI